MPSKGQTTRAAIYRYAHPVAVDCGAGPGHMLEIEDQVIGDKKIQVPVAVVVEERSPGTPANFRIEQPRFFRDVAKRSIAHVAVKLVLAIVGAEEIFKAVVVVVPDRDGVGPSHRLQSRLFGDIGEGAVSIVLVEPVGGSSRGSVNTRAAEQEDIDPAIVVVVEKCAAAPVSFKDVLIVIDA